MDQLVSPRITRGVGGAVERGLYKTVGTLADKPVALIGGAPGGALAGHEIGGMSESATLSSRLLLARSGWVLTLPQRRGAVVPAVAKKAIRDYAGVRDVARLRGVAPDIAKAGAAARDALFPSFKKVLRQTKMPWG